jgi:hypothetical protein
MAKATCSSVPLYLIFQACLSVVVGIGAAGLMLASVAEVAKFPGDVVIVFASGIVTFLPLFFATAIGLISGDPTR